METYDLVYYTDTTNNKLLLFKCKPTEDTHIFNEVSSLPPNKSPVVELALPSFGEFFEINDLTWLDSKLINDAFSIAHSEEAHPVLYLNVILMKVLLRSSVKMQMYATLAERTTTHSVLTTDII